VGHNPEVRARKRQHGQQRGSDERLRDMERSPELDDTIHLAGQRRQNNG